MNILGKHINDTLSASIHSIDFKIHDTVSINMAKQISHDFSVVLWPLFTWPHRPGMPGWQGYRVWFKTI